MINKWDHLGEHFHFLRCKACNHTFTTLSAYQPWSTCSRCLIWSHLEGEFTRGKKKKNTFTQQIYWNITKRIITVPDSPCGSYNQNVCGGGGYVSMFPFPSRHYPKTSFTIVTDTPENLRLKQQTMLNSQVRSPPFPLSVLLPLFSQPEILVLILLRHSGSVHPYLPSSLSSDLVLSSRWGPNLSGLCWRYLDSFS